MNKHGDHQRKTPPVAGCPGPGPDDAVVVADEGMQWWRVWYDEDPGKPHTELVTSE